jgi:2-pyrone-4,6-dicarboxylate lactonase
MFVRALRKSNQHHLEHCAMGYTEGPELENAVPQRSTTPRRRPPPGACDCHIHVSDATGRFPIYRKTHPPLHATPQSHRAMLQSTGLERSVAVQLMAYGSDNDALLRALADSNGMLRGIAELTSETTDARFEQLQVAGIRGLRFYLEPPRRIPGLSVSGVGVAELIALAPRMKQFGWLAEISAGCDLIVELAPLLRSLGVAVVLEHMAGCTGARGVHDPLVGSMLGLLETGVFWVKLTVGAMSERYPNYEDLRPVHDAFIEAAPRRMLWGSNWPHAMPIGKRTDSGHLLDLFDDWIAHDEGLRRLILSENPARLFEFP